METHLGKNHKVLFIWHEEIDAPFVYALSYELYLGYYFYIYKLFLPLMLSDILSFLFLLYFY